MKRACLAVCLLVCMLLVSGLASAGSYTKTITAASIDNLSDAAKLTVNRSFVATGGTATLQDGEPNATCKAEARVSVWYKLKLDRELYLTLDTIGTDFAYAEPGLAVSRPDTVMSIFTLNDGLSKANSFDDLTAYSCNDDKTTPTERFSQAGIIAHPGQWYYIRVTPFRGETLPEAAKFVLNVSAQSLLGNTAFMAGWLAPWKLSGAGSKGDSVDCSGAQGCRFQFYHSESEAGVSKLTQTIKKFNGINIGKGNMLTLSAPVDFVGTQNFAMKLTVVYKDGTSVTRNGNILGDTRFGETVIETLPLKIAKPISKIVVQLIDKAGGTSGFVNVDHVILLLTPPVPANADVAMASPVLPLPLPQAPQ